VETIARIPGEASSYRAEGDGTKKVTGRRCVKKGGAPVGGERMPHKMCFGWMSTEKKGKDQVDLKIEGGRPERTGAGPLGQRKGEKPQPPHRVDGGDGYPGENHKRNRDDTKGLTF